MTGHSYLTHFSFGFPNFKGVLEFAWYRIFITYREPLRLTSAFLLVFFLKLRSGKLSLAQTNKIKHWITEIQNSSSRDVAPERCNWRCCLRFGHLVWQAVTAKSSSSFKSWSNRLLTLASCKSSMVRLEKVWANLVKRWLSLVWEASVLASKFSISR